MTAAKARAAGAVPWLTAHRVAMVKGYLEREERRPINEEIRRRGRLRIDSKESLVNGRSGTSQRDDQGSVKYRVNPVVIARRVEQVTEHPRQRDLNRELHMPRIAKDVGNEVINLAKWTGMGIPGSYSSIWRSGDR